MQPPGDLECCLMSYWADR